MGRFPDPPRPDHETPRTFLGEDTPKGPGTVPAGSLFWQFFRGPTDSLCASLSLQLACREEDMAPQAPNRPGYDAHALFQPDSGWKGPLGMVKHVPRSKLEIWVLFRKIGPIYRRCRLWSYSCTAQPAIRLVLWAWARRDTGREDGPTGSP